MFHPQPISSLPVESPLCAWRALSGQHASLTPSSPPLSFLPQASQREERRRGPMSSKLSKYQAGCLPLPSFFENHLLTACVLSHVFHFRFENPYSASKLSLSFFSDKLRLLTRLFSPPPPLSYYSSSYFDKGEYL